MISIVIEAQTSAELRDKVIDLARVISGDSPVVPAETPEQLFYEYLNARTPVGPLMEVAAEQARPTAAPAADAPSVPESGDTSSNPEASAESATPDPEKLRSRIRQVLAPLVTSPRAQEVKDLLGDFGGNVTKCPDEQLEKLLVAAEELVNE
jgi:hypothetical protein